MTLRRSKTTITVSRATVSKARRWLVCLSVFALHGMLTTGDCAARDWALSGKQVGPAVLPFQAARIQLTVVNNGAEPRRPPSTLLGTFLSIKAPGADDWRMLKGTIVRPLFPADYDPLWARDFETPQKVGAGEELTWTVAVGAEWGPNDFQPLFPQPGTYMLRATWLPTDEPVAEPIVTEISITVQDPKGDDEKVFLELKNDRDLTEIFLEPLTAPKYRVDHGIVARDHETARKLIRIVEQHPRSSYSEYARFGLARYAMTSLRGPYYVAPGSKVAVIEQLEGIASKDFAYGDYALSLLRRVQQSRHSRDEKKAAAELDRLFPDSLIRLEDLAQRLTLEEWKKLNPRKPVQHKSADK